MGRTRKEVEKDADEDDVTPRRLPSHRRRRKPLQRSSNTSVNQIDPPPVPDSPPIWTQQARSPPNASNVPKPPSAIPRSRGYKLPVVAVERGYKPPGSSVRQVDREVKEHEDEENEAKRKAREEAVKKARIEKERQDGAKKAKEDARLRVFNTPLKAPPRPLNIHKPPRLSPAEIKLLNRPKTTPNAFLRARLLPKPQPLLLSEENLRAHEQNFVAKGLVSELGRMTGDNTRTYVEGMESDDEKNLNVIKAQQVAANTTLNRGFLDFQRTHVEGMATKTDFPHRRLPSSW